MTRLKIADGAIGANQILPGAVGAPQIAAGGVGTTQLADGAITVRDRWWRAVLERPDLALRIDPFHRL